MSTVLSSCVSVFGPLHVRVQDAIRARRLIEQARCAPHVDDATLSGHSQHLTIRKIDVEGRGSRNLQIRRATRWVVHFVPALSSKHGGKVVPGAGDINLVAVDIARRWRLFSGACVQILQAILAVS